LKKEFEYEIQRQANVLDSGKKLVQETRGWSDEKGMTFSRELKKILMIIDIFQSQILCL